MRNSRNKRGNNKIKNNFDNKLIFFYFFVIIIFISVVFGIFNSFNTKILNRISIENINVSNLELTEVHSKLNDVVKERLAENVSLQYNNYETSISLEQLDVGINEQELVNYAYSIGRNSNLIISNYQIILTNIFGKNIKGNVKYNEKELDTIIDDICVKVPDLLEEASYYIEDNNLIILPGKGGIVVEREILKNKIIEEMENRVHKNEKNVIKIDVKYTEPKPINIEEIEKEICKEVENARYDGDAKKVYPEQNGIEFDIAKEEVKNILSETKDEYVIPLKIIKAEVTIEELGNTIFIDELGKYSTRYNITNENRNTNIELASQKIDGYILKPGETFSYNKVVGQRTIAAGYKEAAVYVNGEVVDGVGGGICQVSSTLYNAVLYANLEVVSRKNHYFLTSYVGASRDATVSYGTIDFMFKNNRSYPIKIQCISKNGVTDVKILGLKEETEYEVVIQNETTEVIPYTTKYINTSNLESGAQKTIRNGVNGYKSEAYKILKLNGNIISKELLSKDTYSPMQELVEVGV